MQKLTTSVVLTGDIVNSSGLTQPEKRKMLKTLKQAMEAGLALMHDWKPEIFQGDSFQGATTVGITQSLRYALMVFALFRKQSLMIRIALGMGTLSFDTGNVSTNDGSAYLHSGRTLEELKKKSGNFIGIKTPDEETNLEYEVHCTSLDYLLTRCTPLQAEGILYTLQGMTQIQIAQKLKISQPTVQQRLQAAGWPVFKAILQRFESKY